MLPQQRVAPTINHLPHMCAFSILRVLGEAPSPAGTTSSSVSVKSFSAPCLELSKGVMPLSSMIMTTADHIVVYQCKYMRHHRAS